MSSPESRACGKKKEQCQIDRDQIGGNRHGAHIHPCESKHSLPGHSTEKLRDGKKSNQSRRCFMFKSPSCKSEKMLHAWVFITFECKNTRTRVHTHMHARTQIDRQTEGQKVKSCLCFKPKTLFLAQIHCLQQKPK